MNKYIVEFLNVWFEVNGRPISVLKMCSMF